MTSQRLWPALSVVAMAGAAAALVVAVLNGSEQRDDKEAAQGELLPMNEIDRPGMVTDTPLLRISRSIADPPCPRLCRPRVL